MRPRDAKCQIIKDKWYLSVLNKFITLKNAYDITRLDCQRVWLSTYLCLRQQELVSRASVFKEVSLQALHIDCTLEQTRELLQVLMPRSHPQRVQGHWSKMWPGYQDFFKLQVIPVCNTVENHYFRACVSQRKFGGTQGKCTLFLSIALTSTSKWALGPFYPRVYSSPLLLTVTMVFFCNMVWGF